MEVEILQKRRESKENLVSRFEFFFRETYYKELLGAVQGGQVLVIDWESIEAFDSNLADLLLAAPAEVFAAMQEAVLNVDVGQELEKITIRVKNAPSSQIIDIRDLRSAHIGQFVGVKGIIKQASEVRPEITEAVFECQICGKEVKILQAESAKFKKPYMCECGNKRGFDLKERKLIDIQRIVVEESPDMIEGGAQPRKISIFLRDDLVDPKFQKKVVPGNKVLVNGILNDVPLRLNGKEEGKRREIYLDSNWLEPIEIEFEEIEITPEDEKKIKALAKNPSIYALLIKSIAPSIFGYEDVKEAISLQLFGGVRKIRPDGIITRGDIHIFLVGDPGCLVADERIVLGDGTIAKIGEIGKEHLQRIKIQVLTGEGGKRRDLATCFHKYEKQSILEIITESGKSIKGTPNHPLLSIRPTRDGLIREWKRLDEFKVGDRVAVVTSIPCTITKYIDTSFKPLDYHRGPHFKGKLPKIVDPNLAAFMGYVLGDGWVDNYRIGFTVAESELDILPKLCNFAQKLFGIKAVSYRLRRKNRKVWLHETYVRSKDVAQNLRFLRVKRVPDLIFKSGNKVAASFLKWLFEADGTVFNKGRGRRVIALKAKDIELLRDVQVLLLRFGIHSRIVGNALMIRRGKSILKFAKHIGFASEKKQIRLLDLAQAAKSFKRFRGQRSEKIVKIISHPLEDVFDIEVPRSHRFIANGIVSHNTAKSQILKYVSGLAPKARYVVGKSASGAGITATVVRDEFMRGWALEAGALVLCNRGLCSVDELDKMSAEDRVAMHEVMEQQSVTISKANVQATLNAQTTILAAANPKFGRFDPYASISEQIDLPATLLNRFDLIFTLKDLPNLEKDTRMVKHMLKLHAEPDTLETPIDSQLLRKYIAYAKSRTSPTLTKAAEQEIERFYVTLRNKYTGEESPTIPISPRQLEALIRLAEASARVRLAGKIAREDAQRSIRLLTTCLQQVSIDLETGKFDIDKLETGITTTQRNKIRTILNLVAEMQAETEDRTASVDDVIAAAEEQGIDDAADVIEKLKRGGEIFEPRRGRIRKV